MKKISSSLITFLVLALTSTCAQAAPALSFEEDFTLPIVYLNIVLDGGPVQDPTNKQGLAYVASHMLLRGTQKHTKNQFFELVDRLGGEIEVDVRNEGIVIRAAALSDKFDNFLSLLEEALSKPKFTAEELAKVKKETEGKILEQKGSDHVLVQNNFYRFFYGKHPYGNPLMGTQKGVAAVDYKDVVNFYVRSFGGHTLKLFGTGAVKSEKIEKWFEDLSEKLAALHPEAKSPTEVAKPEIAGGRRILLVNKPNATQAQVLMGGIGMRPETPGFYAIQLANHSYGGASFQARLMQEIRVKRGWTYGAYNTFRFGKQVRHFATYIAPKNADTPPAIQLATEMFEQFVAKGITPEEYNFARDSLLNNAPFNYDTSKKRLENATNEYLLGFPKNYFKDFSKNIETVRYEEIAPSIQNLFNPANFVLVVVGDAKSLKEPLSKLPGFSAPVVKDYQQD